MKTYYFKELNVFKDFCYILSDLNICYSVSYHFLDEYDVEFEIIIGDSK